MESFLSEEWRDIPGYEGLYEVSNAGLVRNPRTDRVIKPFYHKQGYVRINLYRNSKSEKFLVHRLVAMAFIPNPENLPKINHIDGDPSNNNVDNLEWCTQKENVAHAFKTGLRPNMSREVTLECQKTGGTFVFDSMKDASLFFRRNELFVSHLLRKGKTEYRGFNIVAGGVENETT